MASIKIRDFQRLLREIGAQEVRTSGTHQIWELPNGHRIPLVLGNGELSRNVLGSMRREFKNAGLEVTF
jgi:predicted RNA binding protein YcfA (HicA-like mRNA interferase family)